jgi:glycosyltransferase involved in cell wall biosynthesis
VRVLIDYRPALRQRTGVGEYAHELARALVPRLAPGGEVVLFSSSWTDRLSPTAVPGVVTVDAGIPVRVLNLAWHRVGWPPVELLAGPIDVAHAMHPLLIPTRHAAQVVTVHDLFFLDAPGQTHAEIRRDYPGLAARHARRADAVIVNSNTTAAQVEARLGVPRERITVCYPGAPSWAPRAAPVPTGPILFIGTIEPRKNVPALLDAYRRLVERRPGAPPLVLAGSTGRNGARLLEPIASPPLADRVRRLGYVPDARREQLYREASMVVVPSLDEGFGMTALEAMTAGVPVVAANRGALPEVVGDAGTLVDPGDPEALARAMERLLDDAAFVDRTVALGLERARRFNWGDSAAALVQAYAGAMARRSARSA